MGYLCGFMANSTLADKESVSCKGKFGTMNRHLFVFQLESFDTFCDDLFG